MKTTQGVTLAFTNHSLRTIIEKELDPEAIKQCWAEPKEIYASKSHPGQWRVTGYGVCMVGKIEATGEFLVITVYLDRVLTAPRADQLDTPEGKRFAERYKAGLGRG